MFANKEEFVCTGWKPIRYTAETAIQLSKKDTQAGKDVLYHNSYGKKLGCWK